MSSAGIRAVITVDTEADNAWENHMGSSVRNVQALSGLKGLLRRYEARITCLVSYRVVRDADARAILAELAGEGLAEIGAHLHPWENPPFMNNGLDHRYHTFPHELPADVFAAKLEVLTRELSRQFDPPRSYRAGRWGLASEHVPVLERLGYAVDTSVSPLINWRGKKGLPAWQGGRGGCDYRRAPLEPYRLSYRDVTRAGSSKLTEMPVTVQFTRPAPAWMVRLYARLPEPARRVLRKPGILRPVWAFAAEQSAEDLRCMVRSFIASGVRHFNMAFHSSEIMLGCSPRSRTAHMLARTLGNIEQVLAQLAATGRCRFCTLSQAAQEWRGQVPALKCT